MALQQAFSKTVLGQYRDNFVTKGINNGLDFLTNKELKVAEDLTAGDKQFKNDDKLILVDAKGEYVKYTSQGMAAFYGWSDVKDRAFEIANPFKAVLSDLSSFRTKVEDTEKYMDFVKETYKHLAVSIIETVLATVYALIYIGNAMVTRPMGKKASFKNFAMGVVYLLGNIVSAALVTVLSLTQNAINIVKDLVYGTVGLVIQPIFNKLVRGYLGVDKPELEGQAKKDADAAETDALKAKVEMLKAKQEVAQKQVPEYLLERAGKTFETVDVKVNKEEQEKLSNDINKAKKSLTEAEEAATKNVTLELKDEKYVLKTPAEGKTHKQLDITNAKAAIEEFDTAKKALFDAERAKEKFDIEHAPTKVIVKPLTETDANLFKSAKANLPSDGSVRYEIKEESKTTAPVK